MFFIIMIVAWHIPPHFPPARFNPEPVQYQRLPPPVRHRP